MRWKRSKLLIHSNLLFGIVRLDLPSGALVVSPAVVPLAVHKVRNISFQKTFSLPSSYNGRNPSFWRTASIIFLNICMSSVIIVFFMSSSLVGNILMGIKVSRISLFFNAFDRSAFLVLRNEIRNRHLVVVRSVKFICWRQSLSSWGFTLAGMLLLVDEIIVYAGVVNLWGSSKSGSILRSRCWVL